MMDIASEKQPIYKEQSDKLRSEAIKKDLGAKLISLQAIGQRGKVNLYETDTVIQITSEYLKGCQDTGTVPTVVGLSAAFGLSRQRVNEFMREHPGHRTTDFLDTFKEMAADVLIQAGLARYLSESLSIFLLKNCAAMSDRVEIEATANTAPLGESINQQALEERIAGSVVLDDDDY